MKLLLYTTIFKEGGKQMKDRELQLDRKSHVLYSKPCKKEILAIMTGILNKAKE